MKLITLLILSIVTLNATNHIHSSKIQKLANSLNLFAGTKASVQWERIFSTERRLKRYSLSHLPQDLRDQLKNYLISHAADSDRPIIPGL